jgi:hypothetical protein
VSEHPHLLFLVLDLVHVHVLILVLVLVHIETKGLRLHSCGLLHAEPSKAPGVVNIQIAARPIHVPWLMQSLQRVAVHLRREGLHSLSPSGSDGGEQDLLWHHVRCA